jgi:hypothetical protein
MSQDTRAAPEAARPAPSYGLPRLGIAPTTVWLICILLGAFVFFSQAGIPAVTFSENALLNVGNVLVPLVILAAFIERAVEVVITPIHGDKRDRLRLEILATSEAGETERGEVAERNLLEHRLTTRRRALILAVSLGIFAGVLGVRGLSNLIVGEPAPAFQFFDITLTGLVVGGGADGIHRVVKAFTDYVDMISRSAQAKA